MFLLEHSGRKALSSVVIFDLHLTLKDDGAGVEIFVDVMDGAAGDLFARGQNSFVYVDAISMWARRTFSSDIESTSLTAFAASARMMPSRE